MQFKPFKRPSFVSQSPALSQHDESPSSPPAKRRRTSQEATFKHLDKTKNDAPTVSQRASTFRTPLVTVRNSSQATDSPLDDTNEAKRVYSALWRKKTAKMHKTWDGDGILTVADGYASLKNDKGKHMGRTACKTSLLPGSQLSISGMDVEIEDVLSAEPSEQATDLVPDSPPTSTASRPSFVNRPTLSTLPKKLPAELVVPSSKKIRLEPIGKVAQIAMANPASRTNSATSTGRTSSATSDGPVAKHDPRAVGALVMKRPRSVRPGKQVVDVVVDPFICKHLREHQRLGVSFMYECVMGMRCKEGAGAILADEMGLGKSLQTIALLWTLLKQNPEYGDRPVVRKAIVVCPASVTKNWKKEFRKWLGNERIGVLQLDDQKKIRSFTRGRSYQVLVVGYEMFNLIQKDLQKCEEIDIIVADEGHRLKTSKNKTATAIKELDIERRIVLTGTLLQNDYSEWYSVVDFVNPGFLGKYSSFKRDFENKILRARQLEASPEDIEKGEEADAELKAQTGSFILRRTVDILARYLPAKTEYVVLCRPTDFQVQVYNAILTSGTLTAALRNSELSLSLINILKKACNSPALLALPPQTTLKPSKPDDAESINPSILSDLHATIPPSKLRTGTTSGKLRVLDQLLHRIYTTTSEKVVVMSNYTTTLDIIANLVSNLSYAFTRLDGSTPASKRQDMVDAFNAAPQRKHFVFLMSTKAGGVGLNLIGASRLVLFDADWNPALDLQAMGRICRDGQRRRCWIYRLVTKGCIEERIFQRQVAKLGLAESVVDDRRGGRGFSAEELRDLFGFDGGEGCRVHRALGCGCEMMGAVPGEEEEKEEEEEEEQGEGREELEEGTARGFVRASKVEREGVRGRSASPVKKGKEGLGGLMLYGHLDAGRYREMMRGGQGAVEGGFVEVTDDEQTEGQEEHDDEADEGDTGVKDAILRKVIMEPTSSVDFVFSKTSENNSAKEVKALQRDLE
ncbi:hypothetical protein CAC42_7089 [Sphaceloma murrayae]|uniref:DNA repair and recombination protein RAD54B n=1 Tax=Sphaceloma murrayae TaxID=2082308 RepID=A0A2K1QQP4_9PEZI|nr:hypothetical protein CAC42_7089 [Sphaceloma murrayae]